MSDSTRTAFKTPSPRNRNENGNMNPNPQGNSLIPEPKSHEKETKNETKTVEILINFEPSSMHTRARLLYTPATFTDVNIWRTTLALHTFTSCPDRLHRAGTEISHIRRPKTRHMGFQEFEQSSDSQPSKAIPSYPNQEAQLK